MFFWRRSEEAVKEQMLDEILASCDTSMVDAPAGLIFRRHSGVLRAVVQELRHPSDGRPGMSVLDIIGLLTAILDAIQVIGPIVRDIVQRIRDMRK